MDRLVNFINHGILPFAGRSENLHELVSFWRTMLDAQELRTMLLVGEAGVGKSRLIDEAVPAIESAGGTVIRARLIPESGTSIVPLLSEALWYNEKIRRLLKSEPDGSPGTLAAWIRRIARLRPTMLIVEDIHLLGQEAVPELASLLHSIAEETLALVCSARPTELPVRGLLERFLVDLVRLDGLETPAIAALWNDLFQHPAPPGIPDAIARATGGNPLAIRTALRSAIKSDALQHDPLSDTWRPATTLDALTLSMRRSTDLLAEGMAATLSDNERRCAEALASIGEVFALETARELIADADRTINLLMFKGILVTSATAAPPLPGRASTHTLLTFTHSLLHQHLAAVPHPLTDQAIMAIANGSPLYSIQPFQRLGAYPPRNSIEPATLHALLNRGLLVARHLDRSPTWKEAVDIWNACESFLNLTATSWPAEEAAVARARLMISRLSLMRRFIDTPEYAAMVDEALRLTDISPGAAGMNEARLGALRWEYAHVALTDYARSQSVWRRIEEWIGMHPELRRTRTYLIILRSAAEIAVRIPDEPMLRRVEGSLEGVLAEHDLPAELRATALQEVAPQFLILFDSPEEFTHRLRLLETILESADRTDDQLFIRRIVFLESTGQMEAALRASEDGIERSQRLGLARTGFQCALTRLCALGAFGYDLQAIEHDAWALCESAGGDRAARDRRHCAIYLAEVGLLRNDPDWTRRMLARFGSGEEDRSPSEQILLGLAAGNLREVVEDLAAEDDPGSPDAALIGLAAAVAGKDPGVQKVETALNGILERPILRTADMVTQTTALALADSSGMKHLAGDIATGLAHSLEWLSERGLGGYLSAMTGRFAHHLSRRDLAFWRGRASELLQQRNGPEPATRGGHYRITMIGTIAVTMPDGEIRPIRGARLKTMLGLLVATRMVAKPLTNNEFCRLAAGGELEMDLARKTMNMAVVRLREAIGQELISTGEETHELNLDIATVDLLEADAQLHAAAAALRRRALMVAYPTTMKALSLIRSEVPFPGLYDDFFEALREDFENRQRTTVVDVARALIAENDPESASALLKEAFDWMPDDEEIAELLRLALERSGMHTDAHRVRLQSGPELEV